MLAVGAALPAALLAAAPARAQTSGDGFLFRPPPVTLTLRGGLDQALARSDVFDDITDQLTLGRGDFAGATLGADLAVRLHSRLDLVLGANWTSTTARSEFRDFVDNDDLPIEQRTRLRRVPLTATLRGYLAPRGREVGRFAWLPTRFAPFVGAGGGAMIYSYTQNGDFVNFRTLNVFNARYEASGVAPTAHGLLGAETSLSTRLALTTEARYTWARAQMGESFRGFDPIDLSGLAVTAGLTLRF